MSYIYEALKRAEDERAKGAGVSRPRRRSVFAVRQRSWLWILIAIIGANAALLAVMTLVRSRDATTAPSPERVAAPATAVPTAVPPADVTAAPPPVVASPPATGPVPPAAKTAAPAPRVPAAASSTHATPSPGVAARETADPQPAPAPLPPPVAAVTPVTPAVAPPPAVALPPAVVSPPAAVTSPAAPPPAAAEPPKLQVQVVLYSDVPSERLVFINGRRYAEGDRVDADTVVERITNDGAVVTRRGERLTLTSGRP